MDSTPTCDNHTLDVMVCAKDMGTQDMAWEANW